MNAWEAEILERVRDLEKRQRMIMAFIAFLMAYVYTAPISKVVLLFYGFYEMYLAVKDDYARLFRMLEARA